MADVRDAAIVDSVVRKLSYENLRESEFLIRCARANALFSAGVPHRNHSIGGSNSGAGLVESLYVTIMLRGLGIRRSDYSCSRRGGNPRRYTHRRWPYGATGGSRRPREGAPEARRDRPTAPRPVLTALAGIRVRLSIRVRGRAAANAPSLYRSADFVRALPR